MSIKLGPNVISKKVNKNEISIYIIILAYKIMLDCLYVNCISIYYKYEGFECEIHEGKLVVLWLLYLFVILPIAVNHCTGTIPSNKIMMFLDLAYFIPGLTFISYNDCGVEFILFYELFYIFICAINVFSHVRIQIKDELKIAYTILIILLLTALILKIMYNGFAIKSDLNDVYIAREAYAKYNNSRLLTYSKGIVITIVPILVFMELRRKRYLYALVLSIFQLLMYSVAADKISLFFLIICILSGLFPKIDERLIAISFLLLIVMSVFNCIFLEGSPQNDVITDLLIRRMMVEPNLISFDYYKFFNGHELLYLRGTIFKHFSGDREYFKNINYLIGEWSGLGSNLNNGLVGDAYGNFGIISLFIYPLFYGVLFTTFNIACKKVNIEVAMLSALIIAVVLIDSSFFTSLITHGIAPLLLILMLLPSPKNEATKILNFSKIGKHL